MHKIGILSSPTPPGLFDVDSFDPPPVKNTFIQFESPVKTAGLRSPPKSVPPHFAPTLSVDAALPVGETPTRWTSDFQIPSFPGVADLPCQSLAFMFDEAGLPGLPGTDASLVEMTIPGDHQFQPAGAVCPAQQEQSRPQRGTPVRISDFLPEPTAPICSSINSSSSNNSSSNTVAHR
eukprot:gb/GFBE01011421.1/.p1 GENE.gb/GFBE01011421.1/~~gb/GFBE01011421.1/.p1  ORF type:complete len:178 (+),score=22.30 gb/GFBE01011421.1/:1-534(+)